MYNIDYLLKYVSNDTFKKIKNKSSYILSNLDKNYVDVDLNIKYLIKYGISNIDEVIYLMLEELTTNHNVFIKSIMEYEKKLTKEKVIALIENQ